MGLIYLADLIEAARAELAEASTPPHPHFSGTTQGKDGVWRRFVDGRQVPFDPGSTAPQARPQQVQPVKPGSASGTLPGSDVHPRTYSNVIMNMQGSEDPAWITNEMLRDIESRAILRNLTPDEYLRREEGFGLEDLPRKVEHVVRQFKQHRANLQSRFKRDGVPKPLHTADAGHMLLTSTPKKITPIGSGNSNYTFRVDFNEGGSGLWKPGYGETLHMRDTVRGNYWLRETAASEVGHMLGLGDLVPPTAARAMDGHPGSMQQFVFGAKVANGTPWDKRFDGPDDHARAAAFDLVTGNLDRHAGNWMLRTQGEKIKLIDNGLSFPHNHRELGSAPTRFVEEAARLGMKVPPAVKAWGARTDQLANTLKHYKLDKDEIELAAKRLKILSERVGDPYGNAYEAVKAAG